MKRLSLFAFLILSGCLRPRDPLPSYGEVPNLQFTAQNGQPLSTGDLRGKIWVADFVFTHCPGVCRRMTSQMRQIQEATARMPQVRLVSFTVDPARDTPEVLTAYAMLHHASPERWFFLTGPQARLNQLCREVFKIGNVDDTLQHSTRFTLVDPRGQIRGYYDTAVPESIRKCVDDIHQLARERS